LKFQFGTSAIVLLVPAIRKGTCRAKLVKSCK
jgi:hypothetical protein